MKKELVFICQLFILSFMMIGCNNTSSGKKSNEEACFDSKLVNWDEKIMNDSIIHKLASGKVLVRFDDKYPVGLDFIDSLLYVIMVHSDTAVNVYNRKTFDLSYSFGRLGTGPKDILSPCFLKNNYEIRKEKACLEFYDLNARKIIRNKGDEVIPTREFLQEMYPVDQLNISGDFWIGRIIGKSNNELFQILNSKTNEQKRVELFPTIENLDEKIDKSRLYSVLLSCNRAKDRIVVGMYFFDLILVYNFEGKLLHILSLTDSFQAGEVVDKMVHGEEYIGFSQIYATDKYCYLRRFIESKNLKLRKTQIIRVDWDGNIVGVYFMDEYTTGDFCVDETSGELFCISRKDIDNEEFYDVVSYKL